MKRMAPTSAWWRDGHAQIMDMLKALLQASQKAALVASQPPEHPELRSICCWHV